MGRWRTICTPTSISGVPIPFDDYERVADIAGTPDYSYLNFASIGSFLVRSTGSKYRRSFGCRPVSVGADKDLNSSAQNRARTSVGPLDSFGVALGDTGVYVNWAWDCSGKNSACLCSYKDFGKRNDCY